MSNRDFADFWRSEHDRLYRALCLILGDPELAREAIDEGMTRAWARWDRVAGYDDPASWVLLVARNWAVSWRRKLARRPTRPPEELDRALTDSTADIDLIRDLSALPEAQRLVVVLRYLLDWPTDRVARALSIAPGTVRSRAHRALRSLATMQEAAR